MTGERTRPRPLRSGAALAALGLGGLALTACVSTPRPTPDTRLPAAYEAPAGTALPQASLDRWWTSFNDPQLTALVEAALEKAPDARSAQAVLDEARAVRKGQVRQLYIPSTPLTGKADRTHTEILSQTVPAGSFPFTKGGDSDSYAANFDVSWELDLIGRRRAARQVVDNDLAAARFGFEGARAALAANVAQSYFEARGLAVQLDDARETVRINSGLRDSAVKKGEAGLAATSEGDRAEADMAQAQAQVADLEAQLTVARRSLLILVGRGIDPLASLPVDAVLDAPPPVPATLPGELLARRPDVREAQAKLASAAGNLKINELALFPTFNLTPGVGLAKSVTPSFGSTSGGTTSTSSSTWTLGANLSIPVLNIPSLLADIDAQNARTRQAAIAYEKAVQTAYGEAENAMVQLSADQRRVTLLTAGEARAERAYAAGRKGYALGLTDLTTTLQAEQSWRAARTALTGAKTQALLRAVQTYKALGGGWSPDTVPTQVSSK
ncbi:efflux transporter, outer membrane factor lipoprotein, NodT family [Caulobacter sp. AP07]|uniref:efflux transporter outer membrane subunit n=1 Tax=Caulobacter sp. AP07 TaxID=1144304 RepID=UPI00027220E1|nr:TolC family protein [Caulobacter sp. AP07]EJL21431.1 efflux transporter, outer membrane factor lipoprotein, NodT family [Caulobacter sp. AP07]